MLIVVVVCWSGNHCRQENTLAKQLSYKQFHTTEVLKTNSFTNDGVRGAVILRISQVSWRPLLRDELSQPVAPGGQDGQTEDEAGADCCEAHGSLWRSEGLARCPDQYLYSHLSSSHLISSHLSLGKFYISPGQPTAITRCSN